MKKRFWIKSFLWGILILALLVLTDLHILRGYFSINYLYADTFEEFDGDMEYLIEKNPDGTFNLTLKNNSMAYVPIILYRDEMFFNMTDSLLFNYASRHKFYHKDTVLYDIGGGFSCGTGIGAAFIRPFESFNLKNQKIEWFISQGELFDFTQQMQEKDIDINSIPTVRCRLFLPIFSFGEENARVYSNEFLIESQQISEVALAHRELLNASYEMP